MAELAESPDLDLSTVDTLAELSTTRAKEGIEVDRHDIHLRVPIKMLGDFKVDVRLMPGVDAEMTVSVVPIPA